MSASSNSPSLPHNLLCFLAPLVVLLLGAGCGSTRTYQHDGVTREYLLHKPDNLPSSAPLVIALHGYGSGARLFRFYTHLDDLADENGFAVAYPQGMEEDTGKPYWDANLTLKPEVDDIGFLVGLAKALQDQHDLNPDQTFLLGFSNGGFMAFTLACQAPGTFTAIASVLGTMSGHDWRNCNPAAPTPVLQITALEDDTVPPDGSLGTKGGWGGAPPIRQVVDFWQQQNQCTVEAEQSLPPHTQVNYCRGGISGNEVWFYTIDEMDHGWPGSEDEYGIDAARVGWEFFEEMSAGGASR